MFGWETHLGHLTRRRHDGEPRGALDRRPTRARAKPSSPRSQAHYTHSRISARARLAFETLPDDRRGRHGRRSARAALEARRRRHRRRDARHDGGRLGGSAAGDPGAARPLRLPPARRCRLRRLLRARDEPGADARAAYDCLARPIRSSSIRTSTACNPTAAAACSFAIRRSGASTGTIRRTRISARTSCTSARSPSSARAPARRRSRCGRRSGCFRWCAAASSRMLHACRAAALEFHAHLKDDARYIVAFPPELDIVVWARARRPLRNPPPARGKSSKGRKSRTAPRAGGVARGLLRQSLGCRWHGHGPALRTDET